MKIPIIIPINTPHKPIPITAKAWVSEKLIFRPPFRLEWFAIPSLLKGQAEPSLQWLNTCEAFGQKPTRFQSRFSASFLFIQFW